MRGVRAPRPSRPRAWRPPRRGRPAGDPARIVNGEPDLAGGVLIDQSLQGQVEADRLAFLHERRAGLGGAEDEQLGRPLRHSDCGGSRGMVDPREHGHALALMSASSRSIVSFGPKGL